ncbi:sarcosine oxidase subunit gamma [Rhodobium gokarnense]|uniref:Sarcosine oxidase subunit gamma n=1 Tax=Rhodobium gokarnense TaxID=364296 RepID=A0ABT3HHI2_9HYPH|nr:sarcosine oxidase subunit gamma family protein [Rhodobium gokarnense]MCW2309866.1 sarcosine oxidase subunit gamma [Rhodobium gokarnense]
MADARRRSPLAHRRPLEADGGAFGLAERPLLAKLILRVDPETGGAAVKKALGVPLPGASKIAATGDISLLWLGPNEWMVVGAPETEADLAGRLEEALGETPHQVVRISDYYTTIAISGTGARQALSKLTTLDLDPVAFKPGEVRGSNFAKAVAVLALPEGGEEVFDLHIRASMADYIWCLLTRSGREFGVPQDVPRSGERLVV